MAKRVQIVQTPTGSIAIILPIAERLLAEGILTGALDDLHGESKDAVTAAVKAHAVCDFCSAPDPAHTIDVPDFAMGMMLDDLRSNSTGGWAACDDCAKLVEAHARVHLLERALSRLSKSKEVIKATAELHDRFWQAYDQKSVTIGPQTEYVVTLPDGFEYVPYNRVNLDLDAFAKEVFSLAEKKRELTAVEQAQILQWAGKSRQRLEELEAQGLVKFAQKADGTPGVFAAPKRFFSDEDWMLVDSIIDSFEHSGEYDSRTGEMPRVAGDRIEGSKATVAEWFENAGTELRKISDDTKISGRVVRTVLEQMEADGRLAIRLVEDGYAAHILTKHAGDMTRNERVISASIARLFTTERHGVIRGENHLPEQKPDFGSITQSYMRALSQQYVAMEALAESIHLGHMKIKAAEAMGEPIPNMPGQISLHDHMRNWATEFAMLKRSETFCWLDEPTRAAVSAAVTLPTSVRLDRDLTSGLAGWWYFSHPLNVKTTNDDDTICAFAWSWSEGAKEFGPGMTSTRSLRGVIFSAYVAGEDGKPIPSTAFMWGEGLTLEAMLIDCESTLRRNFANDPPALGRLPMTMQAVERMARFFAAGSLWLQQRILVRSMRPVERHERKRMEKDARAKLRPLSDIQVIELRRRTVIPTEKPPSGSTMVDWTCRWIVGGTQGFWRNQWYPSKGYHQPKHIDPFIKGPADMPLKVPTHRIYTVSR